MTALRMALLVGVCTAAVVLVLVVAAIATGVAGNLAAARSGPSTWLLVDAQTADGRDDVTDVHAEVTFAADRVSWMDGVNWCEGDATADGTTLRVRSTRCTDAAYHGPPGTPQARAIAVLDTFRRGAELQRVVLDDGRLILSEGQTKLTFTPRAAG